jgi:hypothetical protein
MQSNSAEGFNQYDRNGSRQHINGQNSNSNNVMGGQLNSNMNHYNPTQQHQNLTGSSTNVNSQGLFPTKEYSSPYAGGQQQYQYSPGLSASQGYKSDYTQSPLYTMPATLLGACDQTTQNQHIQGIKF